MVCDITKAGKLVHTIDSEICCYRALYLYIGHLNEGDIAQG
jgi:hypothetical protein